MSLIRIRGARTHNLQNLDLDIPRDQLVVITGLSGSGKSSLAFDTLYAEGQRRYVESLSSYARQFLSMMEKPDIDHIEGLSPAIAIQQKSTSHNPRSTVGTVTEIHDYLRLLFARAGEPHCPDHDTTLAAQSVSEMVDQIMALPADQRWMLLAPVVRDRKGEHKQLIDGLRVQGFVRLRVDGEVVEIDALPPLAARRNHTIEVVIDRFRIRPDLGQRLADSLETALRIGDGLARVAPIEAPAGDAAELLLSARYSCPICDHALPELAPRLFSFNSPSGACPACDGLGIQPFFDPVRVVRDPTKSIAEGAIRGWDRRNFHYYRLLQGVAQAVGFDLDTPFQALPDEVVTLLMEGSGAAPLRISRRDGRGRVRVIEQPFEGILPNLERRYRESEIESQREELASFMSQRPCPVCAGSRLNRSARHVYVGGHTLPALTQLPVAEAAARIATLRVTGWRGEIAEPVIREISERLGFLINVGLDYLTLDRSADTLSGGEAQRIRLASQIGAGLMGVMYVLDEPSIGLHQRDNDRLLQTLFRLRDLGNTIIVVEHDEDAIRHADYVIDMGPGAGVHGGAVVAAGAPPVIINHPDSLTGAYLSGRRQIIGASVRHPPGEAWLMIRGASGNNLQQIDVALPVGLLSVVTGVSGSGKSTLINDTLYRYAAQQLQGSREEAAACDRIEGLERFDKVIAIDQSPIGRTPRSNPATYTGLFTPIRELFAATEEARARGYTPGRFSFNVKGGRCETCQGDGLIKVEMHFLADLYVHCDACGGLRYNRQTLEVRYKGMHIADVLQLSVEEAHGHFDAVPAVARKLQTLLDVGLGYIQLGQAATTLSGGEAQRIKLARELSKRPTGRTLYILDEPTTGLHFHDIDQLLKVLLQLRDQGNTIVIIEHNLDVIRCADWLVDLGPEGGAGGGRVVAAGPPERIAACGNSHTGRYLAAQLARYAPAE